jgi:hypothetical protein
MFYSKAEQRILEWREFRSTLINWPDDIEIIAKKWADAPISKGYLTYENTHNWPDAWTLINEGIYCDISIALGMFYTLYYSSYDNKDTMKIEHYHIPNKHQTLNLVSLEDGKYMLNYHMGQAVNIHTIEDLPNPKYTITVNELPIKN